MFRRAARFALLLALALGIGAHLALFQMAAWVKMTIDYSRTRPLLEAVVMTLDGEHPCKLCQVVSEARAKEKKSPEKAPADEKLLVFIWESEPAAPLPRLAASYLKVTVPWVQFPCGREAPPVPPPKLAA